MPKRKATCKSIQNRKRSRYQYGRGTFPVFVGQPLQHGYGLGGVFRGLLSKAVPFLKRSLTQVGKNDTPMKTAIKRQIKKEISTLKGINSTSQGKAIIPHRTRKRVRANKKNKKSGFKKITL